MSEPDPIRALLLAVMRGAQPAWPASFGPEQARAFSAIADQHDVWPLLHVALDRPDAIATWPDAVRGRMRTSARGRAVVEVVLQREIARVLSAFGDAHIDAMLMKGTALAYGWYPQPWMRPRADTDIWIQRSQRQIAERVLDGLGYRRFSAPRGDLISQQTTWVRPDSLGIAHGLDVHWNVSNRPVLSEAFDWNQLAAAAVPVPALGGDARALGSEHALALACVHRVAHHENAEDLLWLYDIHLLARGLDEEGWRLFVQFAVDRQIASLCAAGLDLARGALDTPVSSRISDALWVAGAKEPSAALLGSAAWRGDIRLFDFRSLPVRDRLRLLRETVFPDVCYMTERYRPRTPAMMPLLYAHRVIRGTWRLMWRFAR